MTSSSSRWLVLRWVGLGSAVAVLGLFMMTLRAVTSGERALEQAEVAFDRGELRESIREARRAASLVAPGADHVDRAFARLIVIARGAEATGDLELSRLSWEAVRSAALQNPGRFAATSEHLSRANENLARLGARAGERAGRDTSQLERTLARDLGRPPARNHLWQLGLGLGLVLAVFGLGWSALRGIRRDGSLVGGELVLGALIASAGAACWALAVYRP